MACNSDAMRMSPCEYCFGRLGFFFGLAIPADAYAVFAGCYSWQPFLSICRPNARYREKEHSNNHVRNTTKKTNPFFEGCMKHQRIYVCHIIVLESGAVHVG